jgi:hypothetical protein
MVTLEPAYGRTYKSKAAAMLDLLAGKDFKGTDLARGMFGGYVNLADLEALGVKMARVRYGKHGSKVFGWHMPGPQGQNEGVTA